MDGRFDPTARSLHLTGQLAGPAGRVDLRLALDTGATRSVVRASMLPLVGYDLSRVAKHTTMTSATDRVLVPMLTVSSLTVLGHRRPLLVVAHEFPDSFHGHGLLGRNFFDGLVLTIDFARSVVSIRRPGRRWWPFGR